VVSGHAVLVLEVPDDRFDGGAAAQLALDGRGDAPLPALDIDLEAIGLRMASPAISRVGKGGRPAVSLWTDPNVRSRKLQSIRRASRARAWSRAMI